MSWPASARCCNVSIRCTRYRNNKTLTILDAKTGLKFDHIAMAQSWNVNSLCGYTSVFMAQPGYHVMAR
jgi:hypothetical protein